MSTVLKVVGGLVLLTLLVAVLVLTFGYQAYNRKIEQEVRTLFGRQPAGEGPVVTEAMLEGLPAPIQRYLRYSGVVGKPRARTMRLKQDGRFRMAPDQPWMHFTATQYYTIDDPGFIWDATFDQAGLPFMRVRDNYVDGTGNIRVTAGSVAQVAEDKGEGIDQGTMLRFLNEMAWCPSAFLGGHITFAPIDDDSAQLIFADHGKTVTATLYVDEEGKMVDFKAERFRNPEEGYGIWTTPMSKYDEFEGVRMPVQGQGVWKLPEGDFAYIELDIVEVEYDVAEPY